MRLSCYSSHQMRDCSEEGQPNWRCGEDDEEEECSKYGRTSCVRGRNLFLPRTKRTPSRTKAVEAAAPPGKNTAGITPQPLPTERITGKT